MKILFPWGNEETRNQNIWEQYKDFYNTFHTGKTYGAVHTTWNHWTSPEITWNNMQITWNHLKPPTNHKKNTCKSPTLQRNGC